MALPNNIPWYRPSNNLGSDPKKEHLFLVKLGSLGDLWYAKTASKPSVSYEAGGSLIDGVSFFGDPFLIKDKPSISYEAVSVVLVDPVDADGDDATTKIMSLIGESHNTETGQFSIKKHRDKLREIQIYQYSTGENNKLEQIETWTLIAPQIISVRFGDLDYSSDDLLEITIEIDYMGFTYEKGTGNSKILSKFQEIINERIKIIN